MTHASGEGSDLFWLSLESHVSRTCATADAARAETFVAGLLQTIGVRAELSAVSLELEGRAPLRWESGREQGDRSPETFSVSSHVGEHKAALLVVEAGPGAPLGHAARGSLQGMVEALAGLFDRARLVDNVDEARAATAAALATYRSLFDGVGEAIYILGRDGRFRDVNQGALAMYGCRREDLVGQTPAVVSAPGRNDLDAVNKRTQRAFDGESQRFLFWARRFDDTVFPKEVRLYRGTHFGDEVVIALGDDVTERHEAEDDRQRLEAQLRHAQKLESIGVLAGGIAHDFNNLLTSILGNASLARLEIFRGGSPDLAIAQIELAARRAADLTKQLLAYAGKGRVEAEAVSLTEIVCEMASLLSTAISKSATLVVKTDAGLPPVLADPAQLRQIVMNLITNASDALNDCPGTITVRTETQLLGAELSAFVLGDRCEPGHYVVLTVSDTGHGMDAGTAARVFEPFFTTKPQGRGLGLAALLGILRAHQGAVRVETDPERGTSFTVVLPVTERLRAAPKPGRETTPHLCADGHILVVDDEEPIRRFLSDFLGSVGFAVALASTGREAVALFEADPKRFSAVLLDLTMPEMGGAEALRQIRARHATIPVVLMSGFAEQEVLSRLAGARMSAYLQKPFGAEEVGELLAALASGE